MTITDIKNIVTKLNPYDGLEVIKKYEDILNLLNLKKRVTKELNRLIECSVYEKELFNNGVNLVAGMDEVGRGPLVGPVVTSCVILPKDYLMYGINDSKKVNEKNRNILYDIIMRDAISVGIGIVDCKIIDEINILNATKIAMKKAVEAMKIKPEHILIDALTIDEIAIKQTGIIKGDSKSISIAAASIVAKVTRDRMLVEYHNTYPQYNFIKNKGYGTKEHINAIKQYGLTPLHRRSFTKNFTEEK